MTRAAFLLAAVAACAHGAATDPRRVDRDDAIVYLDAVADAAVWIDGVYVGAVADVRRGMALEPGHHRLELHHDAYWTHYQELDLAPAQRLRLPVELAPILP